MLFSSSHGGILPRLAATGKVGPRDGYEGFPIDQLDALLSAPAIGNQATAHVTGFSRAVTRSLGQLDMLTPGNPGEPGSC